MSIWNQGDFETIESHSWFDLGLSVTLGRIFDEYVLIYRDTDAGALIERTTGKQESIERRYNAIVAANDA